MDDVNELGVSILKIGVGLTGGPGVVPRKDGGEGEDLHVEAQRGDKASRIGILKMGGMVTLLFPR